MKYVILGIAIIAVIFIVLLTRIPIGIEPLTEVYFENHTSLPAVALINKTYNYSFSVHNLEYIEMNYSYNITANYREKSVMLHYGNFTLKNNETITIRKDFKIKEVFDRGKINIEIIKLNENEMQKDPNIKDNIDIHFWVDQVKGPQIIITND